MIMIISNDGKYNSDDINNYYHINNDHNNISNDGKYNSDDINSHYHINNDHNNISNNDSILSSIKHISSIKTSNRVIARLFCI